MQPRYRKMYYSYDLNEEMSSFEILLYILTAILVVVVASGIIELMKVKPKTIPILAITKPIIKPVEQMDLRMGTANVKKIREAWYKVYFSVINRDDKVFTGIIHANITENGRVTQTGIYPCSLISGEERLVTYFTNVKPTYVTLRIEDMDLGFGARFTEVNR
jgi:hypothetical protein